MTSAEIIMLTGQILLSFQTPRLAFDRKTRVNRRTATRTACGLALMITGMALNGLYWIAGLTCVSMGSWAFMAWRRAA